MTKQFELEQAIMNAWHIVDDIDTIYQRIDRPIGQDELMNLLLGLKTLYQLKFEQLFDVFEQYTSNVNSHNNVWMMPEEVPPNSSEYDTDPILKFNIEQY
jgi:hypothetical protein